jgi:hypothetical protein
MLEKMPLAAKVLMIKFWFAGAVCFLVCLFLAGTVGDTLTLLLVMGLVNGLVTAFLANPLLRLMESPDVDLHPWLLFYGRGYGSFCANILYAVLLTFLSYGLFCLLRITTDPILFGVAYCAADVLILQIKRLKSVMKQK